MTSPVFPTAATIGAAFFQESTRHLDDARLLSEHGRYAASIASTLKAIELSVKAVLIANNAGGVFDKALTEHAILTSMEGNVFLRGIVAQLEARGGNLLLSKIKEAEKLNPSSFADQFKAASELASNPTAQRGGSKGLAENLEYPFFEAVHVRGFWTIEIRSPSLTADHSRAVEYFNDARNLLGCILSMYPDLNPHGAGLPAPL